MRGSIEDPDFSVWFLHGNRVAQVATVGRSPDIEIGKKLIAERRELPTDQLESARQRRIRRRVLGLISVASAQLNRLHGVHQTVCPDTR